MSKKIFMVCSSPRRNGNSDSLAKEFAKGAIESGNQVKIINIRDIKLNFCIGCQTCHKTNKCVIDDSVNGMLEEIKSSDVLVFVTPIYYYCMSGQLKTFLDRLNPLYEKDNKFKEVFLLASAEDTDDKAMDGAIKGIQGWIDCYDGVELAGVVKALGAGTKFEVSKEALQEAYEMGKSV